MQRISGVVFSFVHDYKVRTQPGFAAPAQGPCDTYVKSAVEGLIYSHARVPPGLQVDTSTSDFRPAFVAMSVAEPARATPELAHHTLEVLLSSDVAAMRSSWQFAAITQFCRMFAPSLKLRGFSADQLESAMLDPDQHRVFLGELLHKLLRPDASQGFSEGDAAGWEHALRRKLGAQWHEAFQEHPLGQSDFFGIAPMARVRRHLPNAQGLAPPGWQTGF